MFIARHFGRSDVDAFLASLTPRQYEELDESFRIDPPAEERLDYILSRLEWRVAHLMAKAEDVTPFSEFRMRWDRVPDDDEEPEEDEAPVVDEAFALRIAMTMAGAQPGHGLPPPRGAVVDFKAMFGIDVE